jgi:hypothetical protein
MSNAEDGDAILMPVDGDIATLLRTIQNQPNIESASLTQAVEKHLLTDESYSSVFASVLNQNFITQTAVGICLTETGQAWLEGHSTELSVEAEDSSSGNLPKESSSDNVPKEPYDVAKLNMETKHLSVFQALRKIEKGEINLNPEFQRAFVWDDVRKSRLIESILIRIPLPAFYLDATDQVHWNVVDGLQRLTTMYHYCRKKPFKLTGLEFLRELEGKEFDDLPPQYKVLIEDDTPLLFYNLMPGTPIEAKFTIFSRVNTGGMQLTPQEIRHALNQGKVTELLAVIANHPVFRRITNGVVETLRMSDRELILRALSFMHLGHEEYKKFNGLDAFLLYAMSEFNKQTTEVLALLMNDFLASIQKIDAIFGRYAFRKFYEIGGRRSPFNKALFEVWTTTIREYPIEKLIAKRDQILEEFINLNNYSSEFSRAISSSTGGNTAVSNRFYFIGELLSKACND